jgi:hypothetical protein
MNSQIHNPRFCGLWQIFSPPYHIHLTIPEFMFVVSFLLQAMNASRQARRQAGNGCCNNQQNSLSLYCHFNVVFFFYQ